MLTLRVPQKPLCSLNFPVLSVNFSPKECFTPSNPPRLISCVFCMSLLLIPGFQTQLISNSCTSLVNLCLELFWTRGLLDALISGWSGSLRLTGTFYRRMGCWGEVKDAEFQSETDVYTDEYS